MTNNKNSTRYYSAKQEKQIAKKLNGICQSNSGATLFSKGDLATKDWLIEAKTCMKEQESFSIKKEWLVKNRNEAFAMNKEYNALAFNFGKGQNYYIIDENTFVQLLKSIEEME